MFQLLSPKGVAAAPSGVLQLPKRVQVNPDADGQRGEGMGDRAQDNTYAVPVAGSTVTIAGLKFRDEQITSVEDLVTVPYNQIINNEIKLGAHMYSRVAVARLAERGKECAVFCDRAKMTEGEIGEVLELLSNLGYFVVWGYFASSAVVISLSQGHVDAGRLQRQRTIQRDSKGNALFSAFVDIVAWAYDNRADDLDFAFDFTSDRSQIAFKIGGRYVRPPRFLIHTDTMHQMLGIAWQLSDGGASSGFDARIEQQAKVNIELPQKSPMRPKGAKVRLRWSGMANDKGSTVTMRLQRLGESALVQTLEGAGYLDTHMKIFRRVIRSEGGMVCFSGVVGSGKSTSLARLLSMLPSTVKIQSIEDPVELEIPNAYQKTISRDLAATGADPAFLSAARAIFRSALDVLYLGEIRDQETGSIARQVLESGHSVFTTTHAKGALGSIDRFCSPKIDIPRDVLAAPDILKLLVYQSLLPVNCPHCSVSPLDMQAELRGQAREEFEIYWGRLERLYQIQRGRYRLRNPNGCEHCRKEGLPELNGLMGRTVVCEMVEFDDQMLAYVRDGKKIELARLWMSMSDGKFDSPDLSGKTSQECAIYKAAQGLIDPHEIEERFKSFETIEEIQRRNVRRGSHWETEALGLREAA